MDVFWTRMEIKETNKLYDFGAFRLDAENRLLLLAEGGRQVDLTLKEFEILLFFVESSGRVIKKDELLDTLWKNNFVEESTLARNISRLRKKLDEVNTADEEKFIETLPKRGYRFLPPVVKSNGNALVIEEQMQMRVRIEETISEVPSPLEVQSPKSKVQSQLPENPKSKIQNPKWLWLLSIVLFAVIGFVVRNAYLRQTAPKTITTTKITPFSGATGRENMPAFSPDGKQIAFSWNGGEGFDNSNIYVRLVGAAEPVRLTDNEFNDQYPIFAPDGNSIAFVRSFPDYGEVILIPALGGAERRIARLFSGNYSISFAPDGQSIAVIDTENSTGDESRQYAVYIINLQTGERRRVTNPGEFAGETTPRFSPDGKSIAFVRVFADKNQDLFVVQAAGGEAEQITFDKTIIHSLAWDADGRNIFFVSYRGGTQPNIWRVSANGGEVSEVTATSGRDISNVAVAPDGKTLAFIEHNRNADIWRVSANQPSPRKFAASVYSEQDASFSPDGLRVVFASNRTGKYAIWLADADGKNLRQLVDAPFSVGEPRFSPDGAQIVYRGLADENPDIYIVPVEGGAARRLTENAGRNSAPTWSADGKEIYFTSNRTGEANIWKVSATGGEAVQITRNGAFQAFAAPDGKTVFYIKQISPSELWRVPANGGAEEFMTEFTRAGFTGSCAMTKKGIYFFARDLKNFLQIKFYDFADEKIKDLAQDYQIPENTFGNLDATDDGSIFLYSLLDQNASSIMLAALE